MPAVPAASVPSVMPSGNSGLPYQTSAGASPDAFGGGIAQAEQGFAAQLEKTGGMLEKHALQMQDDVNRSVAKDLFLQGDVAIGKLTIDYNSLEGANRVNAYPKYVEDIGKIRADTKAQAPNDQVAKLFDQDFARRVGYSIVDGARSAATANKQYQKETNAAVQSNALSHIAANAKDDDRFDTELKIGLDTVRTADEYRGASPEVQKQREEAFITGAWATRLQAMTKDNPLRARDLFNKHKEELNGETQLKLEPIISQGIINVQSRIDSDELIAKTGSGSIEEKVKKFEGYTEKPYSDFKQTSVGYGTKAQPGDENIPPEQRKAVYTQRLRTELASAYQIVDNFAPGLPKGARDALADLTYNAGSSWTSAGLGIAIRSGNMETAKEKLLEYNKAGGQFNQGLYDRRKEELSWWNTDKGTGDPESRLGQTLELAKERAIRLFPDDPANQAKYVDTLQNRIKTDYNVLQSTARDLQLQTRNVVQAELFDPDHHVTSYDKLSAKAQQAYDQAPPALQQTFNEGFRKNATADVPLTNQRQSRYDTLYGMRRNQPEQFMALNVDAEDLPRAQKSALLKMQVDRKALLDEGIKLGSAMATMQPFLNDAQIYKSTKDPDKNAEYNKFSGVFEQALVSFEQEKKRPPTDKETREIGQGLLKDIVTSKGMLWDSKAKAYSVVADKTPINVGSLEEARALPSGATFVFNGETRTRK